MDSSVSCSTELTPDRKPRSPKGTWGFPKNRVGFKDLGFRDLGFRGFRGHIGIMEKKMESTALGSGFRIPRTRGTLKREVGLHRGIWG